MAASTSAHSNNDYRYDVFINYRPSDLKHHFALPLYQLLISHGLRVFLHRDELLQGRDYYKIEGVIRTASVLVASFSPNYAYSKWCLQELVFMWESGAPIIPVFFDVKPTDLRWGKEMYAQWVRQFKINRTSESKERYDNNNFLKWRSVLHQVSILSGLERRAFNGDVEFLHSVVQRVLIQAKTEGWSITEKQAVGLHEKVEEFENKVLCAKPQVVGIVGVGGVGKTTLAKELFHQKRVNYSKCCFLPDVREKARLGSLNSLQRQLLKSLTGTDELINNNIDEGKKALERPLSSCRVLMVLDDVDHLDQIHALFPVRTHLLSDSLVLITSRNKGVIRSSGVENASIYHLTGLNHQYSQELFCAFAFNQPHPLPGFESLVDNFLEVCEGLPLLLRVFGALLKNQDVQHIWKYLLDILQQIPPGEAQEKLQISYQNLYREEQQMFLDSSCFFIGQKRDTAIRIWEGSGWNGRSAFSTLQDRCFLGVDEENNIEMHDHLRDFGRAVADTSSPRRLWHPNHIKDMLERLSGSTVGNEAVTAVRGIRMVLGEDDDEDNDEVEKRILELLDGVIDMRTLELLDTEDAILERILRRPEEHVPSLIWLRWNKCPEPSLPSWIPVRNLRVLQVSGSELRTLWEDVAEAPLRLRELEINAPLSNIPESIWQLEDLERIAIGKFSSGGQVNLTKLPQGFFHLRLLKDLVLTEC